MTMTAFYNGDGTFTKVTEGRIVSDGGNSQSCAWGDYDNDGWLDLFVANAGGGNFLYRNNGDGSFSSVTGQAIADDQSTSAGCAWGDYDNDGFLDLVVAGVGQNLLYRNNGNSNSWLKANCIGTVSNRSAIGAKVRLKATIGGRTFWQLREISGGSGYVSQNSLIAHFGLGDAKVIDTLRIEWPSGAVQELQNVAANQMLTITEQKSIKAPKFEAISRNDQGNVQLDLIGETGAKYVIEISADLISWMPLTTLTNVSGSLRFVDQSATGIDRRFYRAVAPQP